jgi:hypothetical protein
MSDALNAQGEPECKYELLEELNSQMTESASRVYGDKFQEHIIPNSRLDSMSLDGTIRTLRVRLKVLQGLDTSGQKRPRDKSRDEHERDVREPREARHSNLSHRGREQEGRNQLHQTT